MRIPVLCRVVASCDSFRGVCFALVFFGGGPGLSLGVRQVSGAEPANGALVVIMAGADWVPLQPELEIEPGSALDFSRMGFQDAPAGKYGRVIARADGQFAFANRPETAQRFYGVNLCFGAQYLPHAEADRLAERLARLGYNAVRVHHYERDLVQGQASSTILNSNKLDQLDYLLAALGRRGLYVTTDLYVSRPVRWEEIGVHQAGIIPMDTFKILVPVHSGAWENWKQFSRALLTHVNPYTGRRYAEDPTLAWLSMINEGNYGNFFSVLRTIPEWKRAWNKWLLDVYPNRDALAAAWGQELEAGENPADKSVNFPPRLNGSGPRLRDCIAFLSMTERDTVLRMKAFLRDEVDCHALITNANAWTNFVTDQGARQVYDYVDDHFYVDHPQFIRQPWQLPSRCPNTSPISNGAAAIRSHAFTRLLGKPFTLTEYNFSAPGRYRGVGGILTGAFGALQGWGGIWRFAYSHSRPALFQPARLGYFDLASDPLSQAAERASLCLFLRGDLETARDTVEIEICAGDPAHPPAHIPRLAPDWHWAAWIARCGTAVPTTPKTATDFRAPSPWMSWMELRGGMPIHAANPYMMTEARILSMLQERHILTESNAVDRARSGLRSDTSQITLDGPQNLLVLDTPKTAGGFMPAGGTITAAQGGVRVKVLGADATVWASALDGRPILSSRRLLVTHLTDLQNSEVRYAEAARQTLLEWGKLPYLVRTGQAEVSLKLERPDQYQVWALSVSGKRLARVPAQGVNGELRFTLDVAGAREAGARMLYEVALE